MAVRTASEHWCAGAGGRTNIAWDYSFIILDITDTLTTFPTIKTDRKMRAGILKLYPRDSQSDLYWEKKKLTAVSTPRMITSKENPP